MTLLQQATGKPTRHFPAFASLPRNDERLRNDLATLISAWNGCATPATRRTPPTTAELSRSLIAFSSHQVAAKTGRMLYEATLLGLNRIVRDVANQLSAPRSEVAAQPIQDAVIQAAWNASEHAALAPSLPLVHHALAAEILLGADHPLHPVVDLYSMGQLVACDARSTVPDHITLLASQQTHEISLAATITNRGPGNTENRYTEGNRCI